MKRLRNHRREWLTKSDDVMITVKTRHIIKFFRWAFGWKRRKQQRLKNELVENTRKIHIEHQHRINKDRWRG